ncbi:hypothetical protein BKA67DRAFT_561637 [Truncatella angustata]|uniref:Uncharacterized protein n=1 Tax=Truncatella angustata TaxID=152316 RepID=A0A9P8UPL0_9PEZI|nr:uncharacterized protein BKA67DRAFT_561637 [Truncatella angustata]KAH6655729.1 hypothetical protein BKA67DRAFT_561637 [Truncatella angustata]KAH8200470.1 hypothetical protein TruAng_005363 [Truncatella angustata]
MVHHQVFFSLLSAALVSAQSTSIVSLFLGSSVAGVSTGATGYVVDASPTATTYVLDCVKALCVGSKRAEYARVTAAPGVQEYNKDNDGTAVHQECSFVGSTEATCVETTTVTGEAMYIATVTYVPASRVPSHRGQENIFTYPGLQAVLITSAATTATATTTPSTTASTTGDSTTATSQSSSGTGNATNDAASSTGAGKFVYGVAALAALAMGV